MKKIFTLFLTLFVASSVWAYDFKVDGIYYSIISSKEKTVEVTYENEDYNSYSGNVTIPSSVSYNYKTYRVTGIGDHAFYGCTGLTSVTIPEGVTSIGGAAFNRCSSLTSITIPEGVTSIGETAFVGCIGLTSVTIPEGVTWIGGFIFRGCRGLTSVTIPEGVTSIGQYAFDGCYSLTSVTIPEGVTSIGQYAFGHCKSLTSVTIPEGVTTIGYCAFEYCDSLTLLTIPNSVTTISRDAFKGMDHVIYLGNAAGSPWGAKKVCRAFDDNFLYEDAQKKSIYKYIGNGNDVIIPNSVTTIGKSAFDGCSGLTSITIPEGVTWIGDGAFRGCSGLTSITIPNSAVRRSPYDLFQGCSNLTSVTIPEGWTWIYGTFDGCSGLTSVKIPESVTTIYERAFRGCSGLTSISIPKSVTKIEDSVFLGCTNLKEIICYAEDVPHLKSSNSFENYNANLYVPCKYIDNYKADSIFGRFANIECISCNVSLSANDNAQGSVEGDGKFLLGETITITAIPSSGFKFIQWNDGNTENPRTITVDGDMELEAVFIVARTISLDVNNNAFGTVEGSGEYIEGSLITLVATPAEGCRFVQWNDGNTENPRKLTVNSDMSFTAMFEEIPIYTISVTANDASYGSVKGGGEFEEGSKVSISATANSGYKFTQWNDGNTANPRTITVTADQNYTAIFEKLPNPTAISEVENGTTITIVNNQILVNGEAPAFVVTLSGKKIANQNLNSGVYFVNVEGETVKVVK